MSEKYRDRKGVRVLKERLTSLPQDRSSGPAAEARHGKRERNEAKERAKKERAKLKERAVREGLRVPNAIRRKTR